MVWRMLGSLMQPLLGAISHEIFSTQDPRFLLMRSFLNKKLLVFHRNNKLLAGAH